MPRYVLFRSAPTALVTNPHATNVSPPRFAGRKLRAEPPPRAEKPGDEHPDLVDHYEVCDEVLLDDPHLRSAAAAGDGEILFIVTAKTRELADQLFAVEAKARATKGPSPSPAAETTSPTKTSAARSAATTANDEVS